MNHPIGDVISPDESIKIAENEGKLDNQISKTDEEEMSDLVNQKKFWNFQLKALMASPDFNIAQIEKVQQIQNQIEKVQNNIQNLQNQTLFTQNQTLFTLRKKFSENPQDKKLEVEIICLEALLNKDHVVIPILGNNAEQNNPEVILSLWNIFIISVFYSF